MKKAHADSEAGVGTAYEYRVGCYLYAMLAAEDSVPYAEGKLVEVAFQVSHTGAPVDDQMVLLEEGPRRIRYYQQCKISLTAQSSNETFQEVLVAIYRAVRGEWPDADMTDRHVIVTGRISKAHGDALKRLFALGTGAKDLADLRSKLGSEAGEVRSMLEAIESALQKGLSPKDEKGKPILRAPVDESSLLRLLQQTLLWQNDLHQEPSQDWRSAVRALVPRVPSQDRDESEGLMRRFYADMDRQENRRATRTFDTLRRQYGGFDRPKPIDEGASFLSEQHLDSLKRTVDEQRERLRNGFIYEATVDLERLVDQQERRVVDRVGSDGPSLKRLRQILGEALRVIGIGLVNLHFDADLDAWVQKARAYAVETPRLWGQIARVADHISYAALFEEALDHVPYGDEYELLRAKGYAMTGDLDQAIRSAEGVGGEFRVEALGDMAGWWTRKGITDPQALVRAFECANEMRRLQPERPIIRLLWAQSVERMLAPVASPIYAGIRIEMPDLPAKIVDEAAQEIEAVLDAEIGSLERSIAVLKRIETEKLGMRIPLMRREWVDGIPPYLSRTHVLGRLQYATIAMHFDREDLANEIVAGIERSTLDADLSAEVDRFARGLASEKIVEETFLPVLKDIGPQARDSLQRQAVYAAVEEDPSQAPKFLKNLEEGSGNLAFVPECRALIHYAEGRYQEASAEVQNLLERFPDAYDCYIRLGVFFGRWYLGRFQELRASAPDAKPEERSLGSLTEAGTFARRTALLVLGHAAERLGSRVALDKMLQIAANPIDSGELRSVASFCERADYAYGENVAMALVAFVEHRDEEAIQYFEAAELDSRLAPSLRFALDQCRLESWRFDDLIEGVESLLGWDDRLPMSVAPSVNALLHERQTKRAYDVSKKNFERFKDDANAMALYWQTAMKAERMAECMSAMMEFNVRFADDRRVQRFEAEGPEDVVKPLEDFRRYADRQQGFYEACRVPLSVLEDNYLEAWFRQIHLVAGLQVRRRGSCGRVGEAADLSRPVLMDYSSVLAASRYGLWPALKTRGLRLIVHPATRQAMRRDLLTLNVDNPDWQFGKAMAVERLLRSPKVASVRQVDKTISDEVGSDRTYRRLDEAVASARGAAIVNSYRLPEDQEVTLIGVLDAAHKAGRIDGLTRSRLVEALTPHLVDRALESAPLNSFPTRILIGAADVMALSESGVGDEILNLFDEVIAGPGTLFLLDLQHGNATRIKRTRVEGQRAWDAFESALQSGTVREIGGDTRPRVSSLDYLNVVCEAAETERALLWADEVTLRGLAGYQAPSAVSCCTSDLCDWLRQEERLTADEYEDRRLQMHLDGHRDLPGDDLLVLAKRKDPTYDKMIRSAWRLASLLRPEARRDIPEMAYYSEVVGENFLRLAQTADSAGEFAFERATQVLIDAAGDGQDITYLRLLVGLARLPGDRCWSLARGVMSRLVQAGVYTPSQFNDSCRRSVAPGPFAYMDLGWMRMTSVEFQYWWFVLHNRWMRSRTQAE